MIQKASQVTFTYPERRILRFPEVEQRIGFKRAYIYRLIKAGKFPKPIRLGVRAVGWDSHQIEAWIEKQSRKRR